MAGEQEIEISIIDKTADFVAKLGTDFEKRINENEKNNPKFAFLRGGEYFLYYKQKVNEFRTLYGKPLEPIPEVKKEKEEEIKVEDVKIEDLEIKKEEENNIAEAPSEGNGVEEIQEKAEASVVTSAAKTGPTYLVQRIISTVRTYLKDHPDLEPPPHKQFALTIPQDMSSLESDIIKLTAQFVARNGHQFQIGLMNREHKNPQFDFLKQGHPFHGYFLSLVEGYTRCLLPPKGLVEKLKVDFANVQYLLDKLILRHEWEKQDRAKKAAEEAAQQDSQAISQIDWYDFVVVETIDLFDEEIVPPLPPAPPPKTEEAEMETEEPEVEMEVEKPPAQMKIVQDYVPAIKRVQYEMKFQTCPKCGQQIPVDQMAEHMRIELLDPKYQTQRTQLYDKVKGASVATDEDISKNLGAFARRRTDIFGDEEVEIGKSLQSEEKREKGDSSKVIWDGHSGSIRPGVGGKSLEDQIAAIHASKGLSKEEQQAETPSTTAATTTRSAAITTGTYSAPPQLSTSQPFVPVRPPPPTTPFPSMGATYPFIPPPPSEPALKKQKLEETQLIPEEEFLAQHQNNPRAKITIQIPKEEKGEWKLEGQTILAEFNLTDKISQIKDKIKDETGMPPNKQKLKAPGIPILKDTASLAYYNMGEGSYIILNMKERGGKNKKV